MRKLSATEQLLLAMLDMAEQPYLEAYFETGSEWMVTHGKGYILWGDGVWEGWWHQEWERATSIFLDKTRVTEEGAIYITIKMSDGVPMRVTKKEILRKAYLRYITQMMLKSPANQAVMEISLTKAIKQITLNRKP